MMASMDRISQLPEPILQDILLLLPWEDAAHMCVLSKRFNDLWGIYPVYSFDFDQKIRTGEYLPPCRKRKLDLRKGSLDLVSVVDKAFTSDIRSKKAIIQKFRLSMYIDNPKDASRVDAWLELASKNCLRELDLEFLCKSEDKRYCLPPSTFATKTMEVLKLNGCKLEKPLFLDRKLCSLKVVSLVEVSLDDELINTFFNGCPSLSDFSFVDCVGLKVLVIPNLPKLRRLKVQDYKIILESTTIEATNLESFHCDGCDMLLNISHASLKYIRELNLDLNCDFIRDDWFEDLNSKLPLLKTLALANCHMGKTVKISHSLLEKLQLRIQNLLVLEIDTPLLLSFKYDVCNCTLPSVFTINAPRLQESYLIFTYNARHRLDTFWFLTLRGNLSEINQHNSILLDSRSTISFNPDELRDVELPPVPAVKQLKLGRFGVESTFESMLDGLLWSCHPDILEVPYTSGQNANFVKYLCEQLIDRREDPQCCTDCRVRCWRHYIKTVSAQGLMTTDDRNSFLSSPPSTRGPDVCFELKWEKN